MANTSNRMLATHPNATPIAEQPIKATAGFRFKLPLIGYATAAPRRPPAKQASKRVCTVFLPFESSVLPNRKILRLHGFPHGEDYLESRRFRFSTAGREVPERAFRAHIAARYGAMRRIAARLRSTSSSVVAQFDTLMRIAVRPCHSVPPHQQVPSRCTSAMTRFVFSASPKETIT